MVIGYSQVNAAFDTDDRADIWRWGCGGDTEPEMASGGLCAMLGHYNIFHNRAVQVAGD